MRRLLILRLSIAVCLYLWTQPIVGQELDDVDGECEDKEQWCKPMKKYCEDYKKMVPMCPKTCGVCTKQKTEAEETQASLLDCEQKNCDHSCEEKEHGNPKCSCHPGYELQDDGTTCLDIDECKHGNPCNGTDVRCVNNEGSFKCEKLCHKGQSKYYGRETCCSISNEQCGRNSENSAINLKLADDRDAIVTRWPWVALIVAPDGKSKNKHCAGVLVDQFWLIAAAHCFQKAVAEDVSVFFGIVNSGDSNGFNGFSQRRLVEKIVIHPSFKYPLNDVAMIKLSRAIGVTNYVRPVCLPQNEIPPRGERCWAVGYATIPRAGKVTRWLQQETVEVSDRKSCASSGIKLDQKMMCVRHGTRSSPKDCQGSTGGPLICQRCSSCDWYVAGVAAEGVSCTVNKTLTAFTSMPLHESWIRDTMGLEKLHSRIGANCQIIGKTSQKTVEWSEWGAWGDCSVTCGDGNAVRTRTCKNGDPGDNGCIGKIKETRMCKSNSCPVWEDWTKWSACSSSCRGGTRLRTRKCTEPKDGKANGCKGESRQSEKCNAHRCPKWGRWTKWSKCDVTCGRGKQIAERICVGGKIGEKGCQGRAKRTRGCKQRACPKWGKWSEWSKCSVTCGDGVRTSTRKCFNGKRAVTGCIGNSTRIGRCTQKRCQVCSGWSAWSECSATCGISQQIRHRECSGKRPESDLNEMRICITDRCLGSWSKWSDWTRCSRTCGGGVSTRRRQCRDGQSEDCKGVPVMQEVCNDHECPSTWSKWGPWSKCDATCSNGKRRRERHCKGESCRGKPFEEEICFSDVDCEQLVCSGVTDNADLCELSAAWCTIQPQLLWGRCDRTCCLEEYSTAFSDWSSWSTCTKTCGGGTQTRRRECNFPDSCAKFNGKIEEIKPCNTKLCQARSVELEICSVSCGGGFMLRQCVGKECDGEDPFVSTPCNTQECPSSVTEWGEWGPCSSTCGQGLRERTRHCQHVPCNLDLVGTEECHMPECGGKWSEWSDWGPCSVSCGLGTITRSKTCLEGVCEGPNSQEEICLTFECPKVTSGCEDDTGMAYLCPLLTQYCENDYMKFACRKTCSHC